MVQRKALGRKVFDTFNYTFLITLSLLCILPLVHVFAVSLSSQSAASAGMVVLWPVKFTTSSYSFIMQKPAFLMSMRVTLLRVVLGTAVNMTLTVLVGSLFKQPNG